MQTFAFNPDACREVDPAWCKAQGFWPNRFFKQKDDDGMVFLVLTPAGSSGDYAVNEASLNYLAGRPVNGFIALLGPDTKTVAEVPVAVVLDLLKRTPAREGRHGRYWWLEARDILGDYATPF